MAVGVCATVENGLEDEAGDGFGVVALRLERGKARGAKALEFLVGEGRVGYHVRVDVERAVEVSRERAQTRGGRVPARAECERGADARELIVANERLPRRRHVVRHVRRERGETGLAFGVARR